MPYVWHPPIQGAKFNHRFEFFHPEKPMPLERARTAGGFTFTPTRCTEYQNRLRNSFAFKAADELRASAYPWIGPISITIHFLMPRLKKHKGADIPCMGKRSGDLDNHTKQVLDALCAEVRVRGAVQKRFAPYVDDSQIVFIATSKTYHDRIGTLIVMDFYDEPEPTLFTKPRPKKVKV